MRSKEYLNEIRKSRGLARAVLGNITVKGSEVTFHLITDLTYTQDDIAYAKSVSGHFVPASFRANVSVFKSVPDGNAVRYKVSEILKKNYPAAAAFVSLDDIGAEAKQGGGHFVIGVSEMERARFESGEIVDCIVKELSRSMCGTWSGGIEYREKQKIELTAEVVPEEYEIATRFFPVDGYSPIDGAKPKKAIYIADLTGEMPEVTVCGKVIYMEERETKTGKPYFSMTVSDGSGQLRATYFSKKSTVEKVRAIKAGDSVCLTGENGLFNGNLSFRAKAADYGSAPQDYVFEQRPSRPVPLRYKAVFPVPVSDYVQSNLFGGVPLPEDFIKNDFVVFDLETTGTNNSAVGGMMDHITEIGAVRIHEGRICEKFTSFVACPVKLSQEIIEITGITDEMLVGAPAIGDVMADFFKFCDGCALVGHNVQFDVKFVRHYGEEQGFYFDHKLYDTWPLAQKLLRLSNYKLNTIADYFNFQFEHHRAFNDAFVTAKIFTELVRINKGLPKA